ncbi:alpha/beta hydrolase [Dyella sp.]|uniref:alpha/beta hydrolase n=1 Tax=Dyella sp. TaxID=1869338 RepID=UPI002ED63B7C
MRRMRWAWMVLWVLLSQGCTSYIAGKIVRPEPDPFFANMGDVLQPAGFARDTAVTAQQVHLSYWIASPHDYRFEGRFDEDPRHPVLHYQLSQPASASHALPVRGSVVLLHPIGESGMTMGDWGIRFAASGYTVVMPDLRSHGQSDPAPLGFGAREAVDIADLVAQLRRAGRLPDPLYLLGVSYGGSVALYAAHDVPDVRAVVALEPFGNVAKTIERAPGTGLFGHPWLVRWIATPSRMRKATALAGRRLGLNLDAIDTGDAVSRLRVCALLMRGQADTLVEAADVQAMRQRSAYAQLRQVDGESHIWLPIRTDRLFAPVLAWMQAARPGEASSCPAAPAIAPLSTVTASPAAHTTVSGPAATASPAPAASAPATARR